MPTLTVNGGAFSLDVDKTLLENLERHQLPIEFHCRDGHCGACRCTLVSGKIQTIKSPIAYLRNNEILSCCSVSKEDISISLG